MLFSANICKFLLLATVEHPSYYFPRQARLVEISVGKSNFNIRKTIPKVSSSHSGHFCGFYNIPVQFLTSSQSA